MEELKNVNEGINEVEETEMESKPEGFKAKVKGFMTKHGKKVKTVAKAGLLAAGAVVVYGLGKKAGGKGNEESEVEADVDETYVEVEFDEVGEVE